MLIEILDKLSPFFVAICVYLGTRYSEKVKAKANLEGQEMQNDLNWHQQLTNDIKELRSRIEAMENELQVRGKVIGVFGDFLDSFSIYLLYGRNGPFPDPPAGNAEQYYERSRYLMLKSQYDSNTELEKQQRQQIQQ